MRVLAANKLAIFTARLCMRQVLKGKISLPFCKNLNRDRSVHHLPTKKCFISRSVQTFSRRRSEQVVLYRPVPNSKQAQVAVSARATALIKACYAEIYFICLRLGRFVSLHKFSASRQGSISNCHLRLLANRQWQGSETRRNLKKLTMIYERTRDKDSRIK